MKEKLNKIVIFILMAKSFMIAQGDMFSSGSNRPRANAGPDIKIIPEQNLILDASRSFIRDGSKLKFEWILSPGLALKSNNELENEISVQFYKDKFIKSIQTNKKVIEIIPIGNKPGIKLEVVLRVKDRIGFEDLDTLLVEYIRDPAIEEKPKEMKIEEPENISKIDETSIDSLELIAVAKSDNELAIDSSLITSGILVEGLKDVQLDILDIKIINSIMVDQMKSIGYRDEIYFNNNINVDDIPDNYNFDCNSDSCFADNGEKLKAEYVLLWSINESRESISIRLINSKNSNDLIANYIITNPLVYITESGVYGLDFEIRKAIDNIFYKTVLYKNLSSSAKINRWNKRIIKISKYPFLLGVSYLFIDKIFFDNPEKDLPIKPPGFPHES